MGVIAAGAAAAVIGGGLSFMGASKNAKAQQSAYKKAREAEEQLYNRWSANLDTLSNDKEDKLYNLGNIFDRFESTGAFGNTDTLNNLRKAQQDFSALAAGDFSGFENQLRKTLSDSLISTVGSGSPIGTYAGLAADAQLNYRLQGINTATGISDFLGNQANNLLGLEFGVMDQRFNVGYELDRSRTANINNARMGQASTAGVSLQAAGGAVSNLGSTLMGYGLNQQNQSNIQASNQMQQQYLSTMIPGSSLSSAQPVYSQPSYTPATQRSTFNPSSYDINDTTLNLPDDTFQFADYGNGSVLPPRDNVSSVAANNQSVSSQVGSYLYNSNPFVMAGKAIVQGYQNIPR